MQDILDRARPPKTLRVGWVGHSQVSWASADPKQQPQIKGVEVILYKKPGAKAIKFFEYPELTMALDDNLDLVVLWIGSNDIHPNETISHICNSIKDILEAFGSKGIPTYFMTVEPRVYPESSPYYVPPEVYQKMRNAINKHFQRELKGRILLTGGVAINASHLMIDGVHAGWQGRANIETKLVGLICNYFNIN